MVTVAMIMKRAAAHLISVSSMELTVYATILIMVELNSVGIDIREMVAYGRITWNYQIFESIASEINNIRRENHYF